MIQPDLDGIFFFINLNEIGWPHEARMLKAIVVFTSTMEGLIKWEGTQINFPWGDKQTTWIVSRDMHIFNKSVQDFKE